MFHENVKRSTRVSKNGLNFEDILHPFFVNFVKKRFPKSSHNVVGLSDQPPHGLILNNTIDSNALSHLFTGLILILVSYSGHRFLL